MTMIKGILSPPLIREGKRDFSWWRNLQVLKVSYLYLRKRNRTTDKYIYVSNEV